ncbi:MAG: single-stranded DNA-binding protein [Deltaproteobacteria bacterium]|nr:single-stranded DNA-binding protein [Deltaproteobacteria bacterium]
MADGVNKVILVGNLGKDPELGYTQGGTARCRFPLATGETFNSKTGEKQERTEWHNIVVWGKQGETVGKYLSKGRQVYLEGSLRTRSWDDEKTGQKKYMTEVNAQKIIFLGGKGDGGQSGGGGHGGSAPASNGFDSKDQHRDEMMGGSFGDDDDIPF